MSLQLKDGLNFPPEERDFDEILLQLWREVEKGDYQDSDLLCFIKTWEWLYSFDDETRWMDDSNFMWMSEMRLWVIKKYIQTVSFLWQGESIYEIELYVEQTFQNIEWINIEKEVVAWRNQEIAKLWKVTKQIVLNLVDAKSLLRNSEVVEFNTAEEIFFFVLNLLELEKLAAYLNGNTPLISFPLKQWEYDGLLLLIEEINNNNDTSDIKMCLYDKWIPIGKWPSGMIWLNLICEKAGINRDDLKKITLKQKES